MKRRLMLGSLALATLPVAAATICKPKAFLTISGRIGRINNPTTRTFDFTEGEFLGLTQASITTATSWTPRSVFLGPTLLDVLQTAGVSSGTLSFKTLDDYSAPFPGTTWCATV